MSDSALALEGIANEIGLLLGHRENSQFILYAYRPGTRLIIHYATSVQ